MRNNRTAPAFLLFARMKVLALLVYQDTKEMKFNNAYESLNSMRASRIQTADF